MKNAFLVGDLVYLRPIEPSDAPAMQPWMNDREVARHLRAVRPFTEAMERAFIDRLSQGDDVSLAIVTRAGERFIGTAGLMMVNWRERSAMFGISIGDKSYWNRGIGTEVTRMIVAHAFDDMNLHRVWLDVHATNPRGIRAYEKAGFTREGVQREAHWSEGAYCDVVVMSILAAEWRAAQEAGDGTARSARAARPSRTRRATARGKARAR